MKTYILAVVGQAFLSHNQIWNSLLWYLYYNYRSLWGMRMQHNTGDLLDSLTKTKTRSSNNFDGQYPWTRSSERGVTSYFFWSVGKIADHTFFVIRKPPVGCDWSNSTVHTFGFWIRRLVNLIVELSLSTTVKFDWRHKSDY